jgi:hypothetical protein
MASFCWAAGSAIPQSRLGEPRARTHESGTRKHARWRGVREEEVMVG